MEKQSSQANTNFVSEMRMFAKAIDAELYVREEIIAESVGRSFIEQRSLDHLFFGWVEES